MKLRCLIALSFAGILIGCSANRPEQPSQSTKADVPPVYFKVDPGTAGKLKGVVQFAGKKPARTPIDMSGDPACAEAHHGKAYDESVVVNPNGTLANVFIYIKSGLEGKIFETPATAVTIDQQGCWFRPRVMGIQVGQTFHVTNSDPVTHNIHPLARVNREWNHSQGAGDPPLTRKFIKPEFMVPVKCNIHSWMHAFIGVVAHPYFAVSRMMVRSRYKICPPGEYALAAWHEKAWTQEHHLTVAPHGKAK